MSTKAVASTQKRPKILKHFLCSFCLLKQDTQRTYKRSIVERSRNRYCRGKAVNITHSRVCVCVCVALVIQHARRIRHIILPFLLYLALLVKANHAFLSTSHHKMDLVWSEFGLSNTNIYGEKNSAHAFYCNQFLNFLLF